MGRRHLDAVLRKGGLQLPDSAQVFRLEGGADVLAGLGEDLAPEAAEGPAELHDPADIGPAAGRQRARHVRGDLLRAADAAFAVSSAAGLVLVVVILVSIQLWLCEPGWFRSAF